MNERKNSPLDIVLAIIVGIPILLVLLIIFSPFILYFLVIKTPILAFQEKAFLKRNAGKRILCTSTGRKFREFQSVYRGEILSLGIDEIVVFDANRPNNQYDWDRMISRRPGFPLLVSIDRRSLSQQSLKNEFITFFKKEVDWTYLKAYIETKLNEKE